MKSAASRQGFISALLAYSLWGVFPLFFHLLRHVDSVEVLMHRIVWSFVFVLGIILLLRRQRALMKVVTGTTVLKGLLLSSLLVSFNWLVFIWAVAQGMVLETSLGYFITPLVSVFLARVFLGEQLDGWRWAAILLATLGLLWLILRLGSLPWVSLALAISFGFYGLVRKQLEVDTLTGLSIETGLLLPFALLFWIYLAMDASSHSIWPLSQISLLLMFSGILTALPLLLFAFAAKNLSLSSLGFMMYINPTLQFLTAVYILDEAFDINQLIGFTFIWCAVLVFSVGTLKARKHRNVMQQTL